MHVTTPSDVKTASTVMILRISLLTTHGPSSTEIGGVRLGRLALIGARRGIFGLAHFLGLVHAAPGQTFIFNIPA